MSTSIDVNLTDIDLNAIKANRRLAVNNQTTFVSLSEAAITDVSGNKVIAVLASAAKPVADLDRISKNASGISLLCPNPPACKARRNGLSSP